MATYNILIMGAAYGSLLASKLLFGGHKIHHVCLPAEADLINAEGFRVRIPDGAYYLVVPLHADREGSYGVDGAGFERPAGTNACAAQSVAACE